MLSSHMQQAYVTAGALTGVAEGLCRLLLSAAPLVGRLPSSSPAAAGGTTRPAKALLNIVVVGDKGVGKTSLSYGWAGRAGPAEPTVKADFLFHDVELGGRQATFTVWHLGGREEVLEFSSSFYSLASAFLLVYSPSDPDALDSLDYWAGKCLGEGPIRASLPLVVAASWRRGGDAAAQQAGVQAAERWCREHRAVAHVVVRGPQDARAIAAAFDAVCRCALRRHVAHEALELLELPALMQSELGPELERLTPTKGRRRP